MSKLIFRLIVPVIFCFTLNAQQFIPSYLLDTIHSNVIDLKGNGLYGATSLENGFASMFLFGGKIENNLIGNQLSNHNQNNRVGLNLVSEVTYKSSDFLNRLLPKYGLTVQVGQQITTGAYYRKGLFQLAFQGNNDVDSLSLSNLSLSYFSFSKIGFGLFHKVSNSSVHINLVGAHDYLDGYTRNASYSRNQNGNLILDLDGAMSRNINSSFFSGIGVSLDGAFYVPFGLEEDQFKGLISIKVNNLGAVRFKNSVSLSADTVINYAGFTVSNLNQIIDNDANEWRDTLGVTLDSSSAWIILPTMVQIGKEVDLNDARRVQSFFGVRIMPTLAYVPQVYGGVHYRINNNYNVGAQLMYGGFANLKGGLYANYIGNRIQLGLGSEDIIGLISKKSRGVSAVIRLAWRF